MPFISNVKDVSANGGLDNPMHAAAAGLLRESCTGPRPTQVLAAAVAGYAAAERPPGAWLTSWAPTEDWAGSDAAAGPALQLVEAMRSKRAQVCEPAFARERDCVNFAGLLEHLRVPRSDGRSSTRTDSDMAVL